MQCNAMQSNSMQGNAMQCSVEIGRLEDSWTPRMDAARHSRPAVGGRITIMIMTMILIHHEAGELMKW